MVYYVLLKVDWFYQIGTKIVWYKNINSLVSWIIWIFRIITLYEGKRCQSKVLQSISIAK